MTDNNRPGRQTVRGVIFDCFGVIRPDRLLLAFQQLSQGTDEDALFIRDVLLAARHDMLPDFHQAIADHLRIGKQDWLAALEDTDNDQRVLDMAAALRSDYATALLTNAGEGRMRQLIGGSELERCFDVVLESGAIGYEKPQPEAYLAAADSLGLGPGVCIMIDDRPDYCEAARALGMQAIMYEDFDTCRQQLDALLQK